MLTTRPGSLDAPQRAADHRVMAPLTGPTREAISNALLDAFNRDTLDQLLAFRLDKRLDRITGGGPLDSVVLDVVRRSEQEGWTGDLVAAARETRPRNPTMAAAAELIGLAVAVPARRRLERMIDDAAGMLDPVQWRGRLGQIETQICRIELPVPGGSIYGTGFLVGPDEVMTNQHVIAALVDGQAELARARLRFDFKRLSDGVTVNQGTEFGLDPDEWLIAAAPPSEVDDLPDPGDRLPEPGALDYALLRVATAPGDQTVGDKPVADNPPPGAPARGWIALDTAVELTDPSPIFVLQHPQGDPVKLAVGPIHQANGNGTRIRHGANTESGSSGSPCFDISLNLIALHHSGDPNFDPAHKPGYNEAIPINAIVSHLGEAGVPIAAPGG
jgi:effector-associated domain 1 (EAD1)-containing protein/trypsin-like peptidase